MPSIDQLSDVVDWRLCLGCGACAYVCPEQRVQLMDYETEGIRPRAASGECGTCRECLDVCPGVSSDFNALRNRGRGTAPPPPGVTADFEKEWGAITGIWEGHAVDPVVRDRGSSGGALTALALYCLDRQGMYGVLHTGEDPDDPVRNRTRLSRTREQLLAATGSRYSPASVCNGLGLVERAPAPCVIIGKPSEMAAVENARRMRPALDAKIGVTMSFFCAETPSTQGTLALLQKLGVQRDRLQTLRYRGVGWPGHFAPVRSGEQEPCAKITYRESWSFLQAYRPWVVQLWPDGAGELADISCGDPWYEQPDGTNPGFSLVVTRTARGRAIVEGAMRDGYLALTPAEPWKLARSQTGLLNKKASVWGRRLVMRVAGLPVTGMAEENLRHCWRSLPVREKLRALVGTLRRILKRKLYRARKFDGEKAVPIGVPFVRE